MYEDWMEYTSIFGPLMQKCPHCGAKIEYKEIWCPYCTQKAR